MDVYKIIKKRRLELGLTLKDVAKALGVAESTVSRYESTEIQNMGIDKIESLSKVLQCSPAYLMGWECPSMNLSTDYRIKKIVDYYNEMDDIGQSELLDQAEYIQRKHPKIKTNEKTNASKMA